MLNGCIKRDSFKLLIFKNFIVYKNSAKKALELRALAALQEEVILPTWSFPQPSYINTTNSKLYKLKLKTGL